MKCFVKFIGILDKSGSIHHVEFSQGLNIITGKSSTGKSAVIEIFDYCFGSSDYTIPEGVITTMSDIYFVALQFPSLLLVLARRGASNSCFIREITHTENHKGIDFVTERFFSKNYFMSLADFKKELGRYFGVTLTDVDEDTSARVYLGRKSPTPSVRSFTSFMLQHQNLVANKHAIFFRFDEKEKREQTIEHFKVFLGLADQEYFITSQQLNEKKQNLKKIEQALPKKTEERQRISEQISVAFKEYTTISGTPLLDVPIESIISNPQRALDKIATAPIHVDVLSTEFEKQRGELEEIRSIKLASLRDLQRQKSAVTASITFFKNFRDSAASIRAPESVDIAYLICPFCHSDTNHSELEANRLEEAIKWLNNELRLSPYMRESFVADEKILSNKIEAVRQELSNIQQEIIKFDKQTQDLSNKKTVSELAMKAKLRVEASLELLITRSSVDLETKMEALKKDIKQLSTQLDIYRMTDRLAELEESIRSSMQDIGKNFDFEESYRPINLRFSLETFDLWHEQPDGRKVFLRSMGSGANWLYCHLTLFLALHRMFASLSTRGCKIPPILFLDQPTQVYFPNYPSDNADEFNPRSLTNGTSRQKSIDEDLHAVEGMYNELIRFCNDSELVTGIRPQIIITDHADHLKLSGDNTFESFVRARWRSRGFIVN